MKKEKNHKTVSIESDLHSQVKTKCKKDGLVIQSLVARLLTEWLKG